MDNTERALEAAKNRARAEWEDNRTSLEGLTAEVTETKPRRDGNEYYHIAISALRVDDIDHDVMGSEEMTLTVHFDQSGHAVFSNVASTLFREED